MTGKPGDGAAPGGKSDDGYKPPKPGELLMYMTAIAAGLGALAVDSGRHALRGLAYDGRDPWPVVAVSGALFTGCLWLCVLLYRRANATGDGPAWVSVAVGLAGAVFVYVALLFIHG